MEKIKVNGYIEEKDGKKEIKGEVSIKTLTFLEKSMAESKGVSYKENAENTERLVHARQYCAFASIVDGPIKTYEDLCNIKPASEGDKVFKAYMRANEVNIVEGEE